MSQRLKRYKTALESGKLERKFEARLRLKSELVSSYMFFLGVNDKEYSDSREDKWSIRYKEIKSLSDNDLFLRCSELVHKYGG